MFLLVKIEITFIKHLTSILIITVWLSGKASASIASCKTVIVKKIIKTIYL